ncbi:MAG: putative phosphotransacetylase [Clostridia bacterium]|nr:putative phosphotransacetylase [Clostridia bacterium]
MADVLLEAPVGISGRHVHLSAEHFAQLFGPEAQLTKVKDLRQPGEFAAKESVTVVGPKGVLENVRIVGPIRKYTQVEISRSDSFKLGLNPPVRYSGDLEGSPGCVLVGPVGAVILDKGVIIALRHIHMHTNDAMRYGLKDKSLVSIYTNGERGLIFQNVLVRVSPNFRLEFHIDTDEANAALLQNNMYVQVLVPTNAAALSMAG